MTTHKKKVIIAGGSGLIGSSLIPALLERGYDPVVLTRGSARQTEGARFVSWDAENSGPWQRELHDAFAVINLVGRSIDCRFTAENRKEIISSRTNSVRALLNGLQNTRTTLGVWVQASAVGFYGDGGEQILNEDAPPGNSFSAEACRRWEEAFSEVDALNCRRVVLRISPVLAKGSGILKKLTTLARFGMAGSAGPGTQYMSWIHIADLTAMFIKALEDESIKGVYNAAAPKPVTNAEFMHCVRKAAAAPWSPPAPTWAVKLGSVFLRTEPELVLQSQRAVPERFLAQGFEFAYPNLDSALAVLVAQK